MELPPGLLREYFEDLDEVSPDLPAQLQAKLNDVRQELPRLFQCSYPMVLQHDDLMDNNNFHVDEATGHITGNMAFFFFFFSSFYLKVMFRKMKVNHLVTGIIDWAESKVAPFGVSLSNMEVVLGIRTRTDWHFHPNHHSLRQLFWKNFLRGDWTYLRR